MTETLRNVFQFFREFGSLLNTALILSLAGLLTKVLRATITAKDAQIGVLEKQLQAAAMFSARDVKQQFDALHEWYDRSVQKLEEEKRRAIDANETELKRRIDEEITKRTALFDEYVRHNRPPSDFSIEAAPPRIAGLYKVVGHNPSMPEMLSYFGDLHIEQVGDVWQAEWTIAGTQKHSGIGIALGNALAFEFAYNDPFSRKRETGVVLYKFVGTEIMRGHWTGFGLRSFGFEECRKVA